MSQINVWCTDGMLAYAISHKEADETISRYLSRVLKDALKDPEQPETKFNLRDDK